MFLNYALAPHFGVNTDAGSDASDVPGHDGTNRVQRRESMVQRRRMGGYIRVQYKVFLGITYIKRRVDNNIPSVCEISFRYNMSQCSDDMQISRG